MIKQKFAVISLSGGMDSSTLLLHLLANNYKVLAITFNYGQKHQTELYRAEALVKYLQENKLNITHNFITLRGIDQVLDSNLVKGGDEVPEGHYAEENMKKTVVPNRNKIFGSIIQAAALSLKNRSNPGDEVVIAMGIHAGDHCFSKNTNILTPQGSVNILDLKEGDIVYSYNLEKNIWEEDKVTYIYKKNLVENINSIKTYAGNVELTDEHKVFKLKLGDFNAKDGYSKSIEKVRVKDLKVGDYLIQPTNLKGKNQEIKTLDLFPIIEQIHKKYENPHPLMYDDNYMWLGSNHESYTQHKIPRIVDAEAFVNVMAWYITEGHSPKDSYKMKEGQTSSRYNASFSQSLKSNLEKVELIKETLNTLKFPFRYHFSKNQHNNIPKDVVFYFSNISSILLKEAGSHSHIKEIPNWLMDILLQSQNLRESFLYTMGLGDGFNNNELVKGFCSISDKLIKQMLDLVQLSGYHFSKDLKRKYKTQYYSYSKLNRRVAKISLGESKFTEIKSIECIPYNDHVYDITVEKNNNFIAGDCGSILISNSIYPDCRQEFRDADLKAFHIGNWDADDIDYYTPYLDKTKTDILQEGVEHCKKLGLDFDKVYKHTMTSYKPIKTHNHAFSDYKSASSIERVEAFMNLNLKDPLRYANEDGKEVSWEIVTEHVKKVLENHKK